jgi:hypothetical protein
LPTIEGCTAEIGSLNTAVSSQQATISAQQQQNVQQQSSISSFVAAEFGLGIDASVADAARVVTYQEIQMAAAVAASPAAKKRLAFAQNEASRGDDALAEGDPDEALERYRGAYRRAAEIVNSPSH